jgi:hypothetical protein
LAKARRGCAAFRPFSKQPLVGGLLLPLGSTGLAVLIEFAKELIKNGLKVVSMHVRFVSIPVVYDSEPKSRFGNEELEKIRLAEVADNFAAE